MNKCNCTCQLCDQEASGPDSSLCILCQEDWIIGNSIHSRPQPGSTQLFYELFHKNLPSDALVRIDSYKNRRGSL